MTDYRDEYPLSDAIRDTFAQGITEGQSWSRSTIHTDERDYAVDRADRLEVRSAAMDRLLAALDVIADQTHTTPLSIGGMSSECATVAALCDGDACVSLLRRVAQRVWLLVRDRQQLLVEIAAVDQALADERAALERDGVKLPRYGRIRFLGDERRRAERHLNALGEAIE